MTIADCPVVGQSASEIHFNDNSGHSLLAEWKPPFHNFYFRYRTKNFTSGIRMTPLVYSMTMPSYANMTTVLHCFSQTKYIENLSLSQLSRESDVHMWTFCINSAIRELKGEERQKDRLCQSTLGLPRYFLYQILRLAAARNSSLKRARMKERTHCIIQ